MRKVLCTVVKRPSSVMEGEIVHLTLEKSDVTFEVNDPFVAKTRPGRDTTEAILEVTGSEPTYGNKTLGLASKVIVCWLPTTEGIDGTAHLWTS